MKTESQQDGAAALTDSHPTEQPADQDLHHGDLRKGAFLRRRANYQMQASAASSRQAGNNVTQTPAANQPSARKRN